MTDGRASEPVKSKLWSSGQVDQASSVLRVASVDQGMVAVNVEICSQQIGGQPGTARHTSNLNVHGQTERLPRLHDVLLQLWWTATCSYVRVCRCRTASWAQHAVESVLQAADVHHKVRVLCLAQAPPCNQEAFQCVTASYKLVHAPTKALQCSSADQDMQRRPDQEQASQQAFAPILLLAEALIDIVLAEHTFLLCCF